LKFKDFEGDFASGSTINCILKDNYIVGRCWYQTSILKKDLT